jgi:uncharacterized BrkB/YihY/UPF0761 family membrane protein
MNKKLLLGVALAIFVIAFVAMIASDSISFGDFIDSLSGLSPRILSLVILPFIVILIFAGNYLRKKNEERKWKDALLKTRAKKAMKNTRHEKL